ncbi:hypothetical protein MMC29_001097 [Sticta canariensis]|nr:hypothetical protein [Sticta canariensis]
MTPIRVRGKKRQRILLEPRSPLYSSNHPQSSETFTASNASTGEPPPEKSIRRHPAPLLSPLERLPTELLEIVFFQCLNVNLPRASPVLSSTLSSFHVKSQLLFKAFCSDQGYGLQHSEELIDILHTKQEVANLQSSILRLRWMTMDFLRQCRPIFLARTLFRQFKYFQFEQWIDGSSAAGLTHAAVAKFVHEAYRRAEVGAAKTRLECLSRTSCVSRQQNIAIKLGLVNGVLWLGEATANSNFRCRRIEKRWKLINCLDECRIPEKLLHGPWTDDKCEFLSVLTLSRATVDWIDSTSGEVAEMGLFDALKEHNERVVRLMIPNAFRKCFPYQSLVQNPDWIASPTDAIACRDNANYPGHPFGVGVTPKMGHLRSAAIDFDCPIEILAILVKGENFSIERNDQALISWALKKKVEGDERGSWLLDQLDEGPIHRKWGSPKEFSS